MKHDDRLDEISAYIDGELMPEEMAALRDHLDTCTDCTAEYQMLLGVTRRVKDGFESPRAPDALRARIQGAVRAAAAEEAEVPRDVPRESPREVRSVTMLQRKPWFNLIAAGLVVAVLSSAATLAATLAATHRGTSSTNVENEVLASHLRSLMPGHLTDVTSNDTHNVKPWFNGRLDLSPNVPRLDSLGFPLTGGRLDYANGRPVAAVVYMRRQHVINVFSWPSAGESTKRETTDEKGYHLIHWRNDGMEYWVASDVNIVDLNQFVDLFTRTEGAAKEP